jgi:L-ascorbate metabolism protein UlaG (beta-lactamase superfamily)
MQITHFGHACVLVESADVRVLIDPGGFSSGFEEVRDLDAIVVTHQHPDHLDRGRLPDLVRANPDVRLFADPESLPILGELGLTAEEHHQAGVDVGGLTVTPVGETHALIHEDIPRISNVGVTLSAEGEPTFFHPGDALDADPGHVDVLAFPLNAPWQASRDMTHFLRRLGVARAFPIHDGLLGQQGRELYLGQARNLGSKDTDVVDLAGRGAVTFGNA